MGRYLSDFLELWLFLDLEDSCSNFKPHNFMGEGHRQEREVDLKHISEKAIFLSYYIFQAMDQEWWYTHVPAIAPKKLVKQATAIFSF